MGPTSTLSMAPKYHELDTFSSSCSQCFLGKLASSSSEHPPGRAEFEIWPSQQRREVFQPLSCYISSHHHVFLQANFFCLLVKVKNSILLTGSCLKVSMLHMSDTPSPRLPQSEVQWYQGSVTHLYSAVSFLHIFWHLKHHFRSPAPFSSVLFCSVNHNEVPNFLHRN